MLEKIKSFLFKNTSARQTVAKNTVWLSISNFGGRLLKAIVIIYSARLLGAAGYGVFSYALTLAGFLTFFMDPGINSILVREVSKASPEDRQAILSTSFALKLILLVLGVCIVLFLGPLFSTLPGAIALLPIVALVITGDTLREFFSAFMRAHEKMEWEAGVFIITNLAIVIFGFILLAIRPTPKSLGWGYAAGTLIGATTAMIVLRSYFKEMYSKVSAKLMGPIIRSAWPFAITGALGGLLTSADVLIVSWFLTAADVGVYSAAIRVIQVLYLVPTIFQFSTLPILSRYANTDNARFRTAFEHIIATIILISVPLALGGAIIGTQLMKLIFGAEYVGAGAPFRILMLGLLFDFPATAISTAIFAYDRQKTLIISSAIAGILNVSFDLLFIPHFGIVGSAYATFIAQIFTNWYLWNTMKKLNNFEVLPYLKNVVIAGAAMAAVTAGLFALGINVLVNIVASGAVYVGALWALHDPLFEEVTRPFRTAAGSVRE